MLSYELNTAINEALEKSVKDGEVFTLTHLALVVIKTGSLSYSLKTLNIDLEMVERDLRNAISSQSTKLIGDKPETTVIYERTVQRAYFYAKKEGKKEVTTIYMLLAIFGETKSAATRILYDYNITYPNILALLGGKANAPKKPGWSSSHDDNKGGSEISPWTSATPAGARTNRADSKKDKSPLEQFTTNLNDAVISGKIDPLIGRDRECQRAIQILSRRKKNNPIFVGDAGVGKTAIAEGIAYRIVNKDVPKALQGHTIFSLNVGTLLAGTRFRGDFEERLTNVLDAIKSDPSKMLFIDEIHMVIGAGAGSANDVDAANMLKPLLTDGSLQCIGATTYDEYRNVFEKDNALSRRFQKIDVAPTSVEDTKLILRGLRSKYETHHGIEYTDDAIDAIVELSDRYIAERHLPDKALDVMDESGAYYKLENEGGVVDVKVIEDTISRIAQIPSATVSSTDTELLGTLEDDLNHVVFGQEDAVETLSAAIKLARSGLGRDNKPIGSFLFLGPTGVGKTEITRQLADHLGIELIRFDMSEYQERHTVSQLIGAPPGYVGYEERGLLTDAVLKTPHAVVLLDEIEKAHSNVYNLLLQIMDNGTLTDSNGRVVDFRNVIVVMTSNAGAAHAQRNSMGFTEQDHASDVKNVVNETFMPEFRNRLDATIQFNTLSHEVVLHIADKFLDQFAVQLANKNVTVEFDETVREWVVEQGYDIQMGARPMDRFIQDNIKKPLADMILFGELADGGSVRIEYLNEEVVFLVPNSIGA